MRQNIPLGVYVPGTTIIHRLNPSIKFVSLIVFIIASTIWAHTLTHAGICLAAPLLLLAVAKIPPKIVWGQLWPPLPFLLFLGAFNWWQQGWEKALVVTLVIMSSIGMAAVLTLTTTVAEMLEALEKALSPTARFGVPVESISLAISLTIRLIPLQFATVGEVLDARKARGADFSITAFGAPVMIRSIRRARVIGDALLARGVGD
ncbi:energy-coupling factor transporter transmembrane component T family protein [Corynebacterium durum]|jgi:cobalt transport protein|uniref:energy-coupling factor transporter transmembrane component T family protein n=1 Tax=Corynebacterium durum TaxID=61592 RepID=UPI0015CAA592|nr:energy-coupling factor transporter transmembrane protein EcfT [Corynebacterium durum]NYI73564.1 biotin transport system permease protein [Corynebacterium durum]WJY85288.1 Energy-coupling factor transporter transmembrane protein EcfT [Corynebacterium durum]